MFDKRKGIKDAMDDKSKSLDAHKSKMNDLTSTDRDLFDSIISNSIKSKQDSIKVQLDLIKNEKLFDENQVLVELLNKSIKNGCCELCMTKNENDLTKIRSKIEGLKI